MTRNFYIPYLFFLIVILLAPNAALAEIEEPLIRNLHPGIQVQKAVVERVLSADTIVLEGGKTVRLIGLKAPSAPRRPKVEYDKNGLPVEQPILPENTYEEKAFAFAYHLLAGKTVRLVYDESKADDDFTTLAYVFVDDTSVFANTEILRYGYADLQIKPPNLKYEEELSQAYREARREKRGMHGN